MSENDTAKVTATIQDVSDRLDVVICLLMPAATENSTPPKGLGFEILRMCDYEHTTQDMCRALNKTAKHVTKELSLLRSKGMIRTVKRNNKQVHIRVR